MSSEGRLERIDREHLFMGIASLYAQRSSCRRASVGVIAVMAGRAVASGYVGAPSGMPHCTDESLDCIIGPDGGCIRSVHAEANMIAWAARVGVRLEGADVWCTHQPCLACAKLLVNAGIHSFVWKLRYRDAAGAQLLWDQGVQVVDYNEMLMPWPP